MIDILLVDDHAMIRDAIKFYFDSARNYRVAGEATDGHEALILLREGSYDVVVTDINMPQMDGIELMGHIQQEFPNQKVLVLSMLDDAVYINKMIALGAKGYILKNAPKEEIYKALDMIVEGENYYAKEIYKTIIDSIAGKKPKQRLSLETSLSKREKEVLRLIVKEYSNKEIADELFISIRTVEAHKRNLLDKTGAKNIAGLVMFAVERNIA